MRHLPHFLHEISLFLVRDFGVEDVRARETQETINPTFRGTKDKTNEK